MNDSDRNPNSCRPRDPATDASRCASTTGASRGTLSSIRLFLASISANNLSGDIVRQSLQRAEYRQV